MFRFFLDVFFFYYYYLHFVFDYLEFIIVAIIMREGSVPDLCVSVCDFMFLMHTF